MITGSTTDILAMALPIVLAVVMGILGTLRGFWREAIVAGSVVLGALIVQQWASLWAEDLYGMYTGVSREMQQVVLSQVLLSLIVLVLGYGLGTLLRRRPVSGASRAGGLLLGLANGSAIGGWLLRYVYTGLDGSQPSSPLYQNTVTQAFMIWAGWFPVALAVVGAIVALVAPFRRSEVEVTQTAPAPAPAYWTSPPPAPAYTTNTATTTAYGAPPPGRIPGTVGAATPYDRTVANLSPYATQEPRPQTPYDAPRTQTFGGLDLPPAAPPRDPYNPNPYDNATRTFPPAAYDIGSAPPTGVLPDTNQYGAARQAPVYRSGIGERAGADADSAAYGSPDSDGDSDGDEVQERSSDAPEALRPSTDWLASSSDGTQPENVAASEPEVAGEPQQREPDQDQQVELLEDEPGTAAAADADETSDATATATAAGGTTYTLTEETCANCGASVLSSARFCTECGTPVVRA